MCVCDRSGHQCHLCESVSERQDEQQCVDTHKYVCKTSVTRRGSVRGCVLKRLLWQLVDWLTWRAASVLSASAQNRHLCMLKPRSPLAAVPMTHVTGRLRIGAWTQAVELLRTAAPSETRHYKKNKCPYDIKTFGWQISGLSDNRMHCTADRVFVNLEKQADLSYTCSMYLQTFTGSLK